MKTLYIFDFDDTLALTDSHVVVNDNLRLTSREFAKYRSAPGDKIDFSEFESVPEGSLIDSTVEDMVSAMESEGRENVFIVTARSSAPPVRRFLKKFGIQPPKIVPTSGSEGKARWLIRKLYQKQYGRVVVYEDCNKNIKMLEEVVDTFNEENNKNISYSSVCVLVEAKRKDNILRQIVKYILENSNA
ncbi:MAG: hypothetical protein CBC29_06965 [Methylococcaceae bacterium TMED69]|nr:MAG: hypothetical protein CBC29_06965 [Methylococcaceae bacterium TMED69]